MKYSREKTIRRFWNRCFEDRDRQLAQIRDEIRYQYGFYEFGIWIVELAESHTVIGRAGLQLRDGYEEPELGFVIAPAYRGHGYAREACEAVLQVAREELFFETIRAVVHRDDEKSLRLCKKLGFIVDNKAGKDENPWIILKKKFKIETICSERAMQRIKRRMAVQRKEEHYDTERESWCSFTSPSIETARWR